MFSAVLQLDSSCSTGENVSSGRGLRGRRVTLSGGRGLRGRRVTLSGVTMKGDEERARAAGCDGYLAKPIDTSALPAQVERWLANGLP